MLKSRKKKKKEKHCKRLLYLHTLIFSFLKTKKIFTETNFQQTSLFTSSSSFWRSRLYSLGIFLLVIPKWAKKNKNQSIGFNPENQWLSATLSLTTSGHQSSTKRTTSFPAESHSQMAVSNNDFCFNLAALCNKCLIFITSDYNSDKYCPLMERKKSTVSTSDAFL